MALSQAHKCGHMSAVPTLDRPLYEGVRAVFEDRMYIPNEGWKVVDTGPGADDADIDIYEYTCRVYALCDAVLRGNCLVVIGHGCVVAGTRCIVVGNDNRVCGRDNVVVGTRCTVDSSAVEGIAWHLEFSGLERQSAGTSSSDGGPSPRPMTSAWSSDNLAARASTPSPPCIPQTLSNTFFMYTS